MKIFIFLEFFTFSFNAFVFFESLAHLENRFSKNPMMQFSCFHQSKPETPLNISRYLSQFRIWPSTLIWRIHPVCGENIFCYSLQRIDCWLDFLVKTDLWVKLNNVSGYSDQCISKELLIIIIKFISFKTDMVTNTIIRT